MINGYIYVRNHSSYERYNAYKLGKTINIPERDSHYATGEIERGHFVSIFEVPILQMNFIERLLQNEFSQFSVKYDAGTEFYNKIIVDLIEPYFENMGIKFKKLNTVEIRNLIRCNRIRIVKSLIHYLKSNALYTPREYQKTIIQKTVIHYQEYDKGLLVLMCGVGKTLISLWIAQELHSNTILIGVPNKLLLEQWEKIIKVLFMKVPYLIVSGSVDIQTISNFLEKNQKQCIVITTYSSVHKVYTSTQKSRFSI